MTPAEKELALLRAEKVLAEKIFGVFEEFAKSIGETDLKITNKEGWEVIVRTLEFILKPLKEKIK